MVNFIMADALTRIQNAVMAKKKAVLVPNKKTVVYVLEILKTEGFIEDFKVLDKEIEVKLKYKEDGDPVAKHFRVVSKPGQRIYVTYKDIVPVFNGKGIGIISTSAGIMAAQKAKVRKLGGEYICKVW